MDERSFTASVVSLPSEGRPRTAPLPRAGERVQVRERALQHRYLKVNNQQLHTQSWDKSRESDDNS